MFYPLDQYEWRKPLQLYKICSNTLIRASSQSLLLEYLRGVIESIYSELALYGSTNKCTRTDTVSYPYLRSAMARFHLGKIMLTKFNRIQTLFSLNLPLSCNLRVYVVVCISYFIGFVLHFSTFSFFITPIYKGHKSKKLITKYSLRKWYER